MLLNINQAFFENEGEAIVASEHFQRRNLSPSLGCSYLLDTFAGTDSSCMSFRVAFPSNSDLELTLAGGYHLETCPSGGWLFRLLSEASYTYWLPHRPKLRCLDSDGHILAHYDADITAFMVSDSGFSVKLHGMEGECLDLLVWRIPASDTDLLHALNTATSLETQQYFLWSSHTTYTRPADLYLHLIHGRVYENHEVWPKYWRVCSELDAYALYVVLTGLLRATGKRLYDLLRTQVVFSVIARQAEDGGWYHGEWTDQMESHYRLHAGGMHMLAAHFGETRDPAVGAALEKSAAFAASRTDHLDVGMWFLHDSLEESPEALKKYPFRYAPSRALGKSPSNLLVLNTHLDTNNAMERNLRATGDDRHDGLIASARTATQVVLALRPAEWLYRPLFRAISLTFLPTEQAAALPLPLRALKRIAWKYLAPQLPRIKVWFPRLVMPGGFIERGLSQYGLSVRYQPVNLMDLVRTRRLFDERELDALLEESFAFTQFGGIKSRWKELKGKEDDSLGFWAEALFHLCLAKPDNKYRAWLSEAIMDLEDNGLGLSPSLLGSNTEAIPHTEQRPCPCPADVRLRVANLSHGDKLELLVVNPCDQAIALEWEIAPAGEMAWRSGGAVNPQGLSTFPTILPRNWLHGTSQR